MPVPKRRDPFVVSDPFADVAQPAFPSLPSSTMAPAGFSAGAPTRPPASAQSSGGDGIPGLEQVASAQPEWARLGDGFTPDPNAGLRAAVRPLIRGLTANARTGRR